MSKVRHSVTLAAVVSAALAASLLLGLSDPMRRSLAAIQRETR
jgi:hypothetical protein